MRAQANIAPVQSRTLRFVDRADGAVVIADADQRRDRGSHRTPVEQTGFIRGVMRGLARERRMHGVGERPPFTPDPMAGRRNCR